MQKLEALLPTDASRKVRIPERFRRGPFKTVDRWLAQNSPEQHLDPREQLLKDAHSPEAKNRNERWMERRLMGNSILVFMCSDSRGIAPFEGSLVVPRIGASNSPESFGNALNDRNTQSIAIVAHFDGISFIPQEVPTGCGGLAAKAQQIRQKSADPEGMLGRFVKENVFHNDVVIQAVATASHTAEFTDKPILAAAQDHRTGKIIPIAIVKGRTMVSAIPYVYISAENYDPAKIYKEGVPSLTSDEIHYAAGNFAQFLAEGETRVTDIKAKYPNLEEMQKAQNPPLLVLSTDMRPLEIKYPETTDRPGSAFRIRIPREEDGSEISIKDRDMTVVFGQVEYPIAHADFSDLSTILVETERMDVSRKVAAKLAAHDWMKPWQELPGHQILVGQTRGGKVDDIGVFSQ